MAALGLALCFAWNTVLFGAMLISLAAMQAADLCATEAAPAALGVAFDDMGLPEIWSMTAVLNEPSQAVMRRLGLTETTRFDHPRIPPGDPLHRRWPITAPARPSAARRVQTPMIMGQSWRLAP